ncbi:MAG: hypothetical protein JJE04_23290 [Acidobacteriia bacterium]|nr:hypothetical protein [Terriglobia bacterium]
MTTRRNLLALLFAAATVMPAAAADPSMWNLVMPDARIMIGMDVTRVVSSPLGQKFLSQLNLESGDFKKFMDSTGFDPRRDLREVLVASTGGATHQGSLVIVRGVFDEAKISALLSVSGQAAAGTHQGVKILSSGKDNGSVGFLSSSMLVGGTLDEVKAAIDRQQSGATLDASIASRIQSSASRYEAWLISTASPSSFTRIPGPNPGNMMRADLFQAVESFSGGLHLSGDIVDLDAEAVTRSEKDASALVDVFKFLVQVVGSNQPPDSPMGKMFDSMKSSVEGRTAKLSFSAPSSEILKLFEAAPRKQAVKVQAVSIRH